MIVFPGRLSVVSFESALLKRAWGCGADPTCPCHFPGPRGGKSAGNEDETQAGGMLNIEELTDFVERGADTFNSCPAEAADDIWAVIGKMWQAVSAAAILAKKKKGTADKTCSIHQQAMILMRN